MARIRVNELDLLRFIAALSVVFFHYTFRGYTADAMTIMPYPTLAPISKYGYLGVELFFMISGFVILMTAASGSLRKFIISRFVRLYPAFWVCCSLTFIATILIGGHRYTASVYQYLINMTMLNSFIGVPSIDGVYWTLFIELKFYAFVALVLLIGQIDEAQLFLCLWLAVTILLDLFPISNTLRYYLIADYSPYFIAGSLFYLIRIHGFTLMRGVLLVATWMLALRLSFVDLQDKESVFRVSFSYIVVAGIISTFFVIMTLVSIGWTGSIGRRTWVRIGALTYPLYLIHQHIGFMIFNIAYPAVNAHVLLAGTILAMIVLSFLVSEHIEKRYSPRLKNILTLTFAPVLERTNKNR